METWSRIYTFVVLTATSRPRDPDGSPGTVITVMVHSFARLPDGSITSSAINHCPSILARPVCKLIDPRPESIGRTAFLAVSEGDSNRDECRRRKSPVAHVRIEQMARPTAIAASPTKFLQNGSKRLGNRRPN